MGHSALGLTDHGTMSGALHHIKACRDAKIIPISGVEAYFRPDRSVRDKDQRRAWHLCLFAKNLVGWHSLLRITSRAYEDNREGGGFYQYPCVDFELLREHKHGLICSTACISGWLCDRIKLGDDTGADAYLKTMKAIFGDDLWLEIMPHDFQEQRMVNIELANLAERHSLPVIATTDAHYPYKEWAETQQVAKMMSTKTSFEKERKRMEKEEIPDEGFAKLLPSAYLMEEQDVRDLFAEAHPDLPEYVVDEAIRNTHELAHTTTPFLLDRHDKLPRVTKTKSEAEMMLMEWCEEGLERIGKEDDPDYLERYEYEFGVLKKKGVIDYFVLVGDVVRWSKSQGIKVGLGRGSAAGCLVSYLTGITAIDPIAWGLLFERFLNPGRKGLPDIDLDFQHDRRDEVKAYIVDKFGWDHVADIISHQTFQPSAAIIDVARTFDIDYNEVNELSKTIDIRQDDEETTLEQIRPINEKLDAFAEKYPDVWKHALRMEGSIRNASKHAAGVVITDKPIWEYMPLERGKKGDLVTSWSDRADFPAVSDHGLVKLDALGTKGLTKQAFACQLIKERHDVEIDLDSLGVLQDPSDVDPKVMEIFQKGLTLGIWQFHGWGITNLIKQVKPDWGGDLAAANALYRPGPMGSGVTWEYADLKKMPDEEIVYWDESVHPVLKETYGIIAYQEQVMEICKQLGGFTGGQADDMRKAMGKLYRLPGSEAKRYMAKFKDQWDRGTKQAGISIEVAEEIWVKILSFGGYGFNKSHSAAYAIQAYQDAYLKAYYPHEFYCALLRFPPSTTQKSAEEKGKFIRAAFREAEALGVDVAPPNINTSERFFALDGDTLRFGLESIKNVGPTAVTQIMDNRPFEDWDDFTERVEKKQCNSKVREALILSGACDLWGERDKYSGNEIAQFEKEYLGMAITMTGAVQDYKALMEEHTHSSLEVDEMEDGQEVIAGGDVVEVKKTTIRKGKAQGQEMAHVTLAFGVNQYRCTFFAREWKTYREAIEGGSIMVVGKRNSWRGSISIKVDQAMAVRDWAHAIEEEEKEMASGS